MTLSVDKLKDPAYFIDNIVFAPKGWKFTRYQRDWCKLHLKHKRLTISAFRSSGKSEVLLIALAIWRLIMFPGCKIGLISNSAKQYKKLVKRLKEHFQTNDFLKPYIPSSRTQTWNTEGFDLKNGSSISAYTSSNENIRGEHFNAVFADEIGEYDDLDIFKNAILPTLNAKGGSMVCVGTTKSLYDLIHRMKNDAGFKAFQVFDYPALGDKDYYYQRFPDRKIVNNQGTRYIYNKKGELLDTYPSIMWSQEFMLQPLSSEDQIFPLELVQKNFTNDRTFYSKPDPLCNYYIGIDFAMGAKTNADYSVITVLERKIKGQALKLVNLYRWRNISYQEQLDRIRAIFSRFNPVRVCVDERSFGVTFLQALKSDGWSVEGIAFTQKSKEDVIKTLRNEFENSRVGLPNPDNCNDLNTRLRMTDLIKELSAFRYTYDEKKNSVKLEGVSTHDDIVVSLALAVWVGRTKPTATFHIQKGSDRKHLIRVS